MKGTLLSVPLIWNFPRHMSKVYTPKQVIRKLKKLGFVQDRQSGSHKIFYNSKTKDRAVIPYHLKELPKGTLSAILKEANILRDEFDKA